MRQLFAILVGIALVVTPTAARAQGAPDQKLAPAALPSADRPFGTLREQSAMQHAWLKKRLDTFLPPLMRTHGVDMWIVPMREYNEDPVFSSLVSPTTFAARRRTIYVFFDRCATRIATRAACTAADTVERIALGGTSQGGVFQAVRSTTPAAGPGG